MASWPEKLGSVLLWMPPCFIMRSPVSAAFTDVIAPRPRHRWISPLSASALGARYRRCRRAGCSPARLPLVAEAGEAE